MLIAGTLLSVKYTFSGNFGENAAQDTGSGADALEHRIQCAQHRIQGMRSAQDTGHALRIQGMVQHRIQGMR